VDFGLRTLVLLTFFPILTIQKVEMKLVNRQKFREERMKIDVQSKQIDYTLQGTGLPILFVHGWGGNINSLSKLHELASQKYKTIILDLPGFGESDLPDPDWGVHEYGDFLVNFLQELKIDKVIYFGHSFGGALGVYLAAKYPELISKLVLCAPSFRRRVKSEKLRHPTPRLRRPGVKGLIKFTNLQIYKFINSNQIKVLVKNCCPWLMRVYYKLFYPGSDSFRYPKLEQNYRKIITQDLSDLVPKITAPTLVLWGADDVDTPVEDAEFLKERIHNVQVKIFEGVGHNLPLKMPGDVWNVIDKFMKSRI